MKTMIHVLVGTTHLSQILGHRFDAVLRPTLEPLVRAPIRTVNTPDELAELTVFEVLKEFHERASSLLCAKPAEIMTAQRDEIMRVARQDYHYPDFEATIENACRSVAIHRLFPHGTLKGRGVFLPEFSMGVRCFGFFASYSRDETIAYLWKNRGRNDLQKLECHLCDTLWSVYDRSCSYWCKLRADANNNLFSAVEFEMYNRNSGEEYLVIDAVAHGFQGHRSMRRDNPEVPALGNHRLFAAKTTRQGIGKPVVSGLFPIDLWQSMEKPVQHFILNAAEKVGAEQCPPLYPNMPSEEDMQQLYWAAVRAEGDVPFEVDDYSNSLRKLGIEAAVRRRIAAYLRRLEQGEWAWDWTRAIFECQSALYDDDIEQSLHLQDALDLYPLHKRVLGLVEYIILPKLKDHGFEGKPSQLWTNAFLETVTDNAGNAHTGSLSTHPRKADLGLLATLETEGNWLLHAADHEASGRTSPIDLASLLDGIVARMSSTGEVDGVSVTLHPPTPQVHAQQLAALADRSSRKAACMTLYLGKVALMLRNAVEHIRTERVVTEGLLLETPGYWKQKRDGKIIFDWLKDKATKPSLRPTSPLTTRPSAAESFVLTPASLERCLFLLSLVLKAGFSHLQLS